LLAHHDDGRLWFDNGLDFISHSDVKRDYGPGSFALLAACSIGTAAGRGFQDLLTRLNDNGVAAAILSPAKVHPALGIGLAINFAKEIKKEYEAMESKQGLSSRTLAELFDSAAEKTIQEEATAISTYLKNNPDIIYEFVFTGNSGLRLCAPKN